MLSYDHMVYEPELYTRLLCGFLDMQYEPAMLALDNHIDPDILKGSSSYGMDGSARIDPQIAHKPVQVLEQRELDTLRLATYAAFDAARRFHGGYDPDTLGLLCLDRMVAMFKDEGRDELVSIALELMKSWSKTMRRHPAVPRS